MEKKKKRKIAIIILAVLLVLSGGGLAARYIYLQYFASAQTTATAPHNIRALRVSETVQSFKRRLLKKYGCNFQIST